MTPTNYKATDLINCKTADEVQQAVRKWTSSKSEKEHLIRSSILDIHAGVELLLKQILYQHMLNILFQDGSSKDEKRKDSLEKEIDKMSFMTMYRILKPCFDAFPGPDLKNIGPINDVRNLAAHGNIDKVVYKGKSPFNDHETLALLFLDSWAAKKELKHFYERMIEDPRERSKYYYDFYTKNNKIK